MTSATPPVYCAVLFVLLFLFILFFLIWFHSVCFHMPLRPISLTSDKSAIWSICSELVSEVCCVNPLTQTSKQCYWVGAMFWSGLLTDLLPPHQTPGTLHTNRANFNAMFSPKHERVLELGDGDSLSLFGTFYSWMWGENLPPQHGESLKTTIVW